MAVQVTSSLETRPRARKADTHLAFGFRQRVQMPRERRQQERAPLVALVPVHRLLHRPQDLVRQPFFGRPVLARVEVVEGRVQHHARSRDLRIQGLGFGTWGSEFFYSGFKVWGSEDLDGSSVTKETDMRALFLRHPGKGTRWPYCQLLLRFSQAETGSSAIHHNSLDLTSLEKNADLPTVLLALHAE